MLGLSIAGIVGLAKFLEVKFGCDESNGELTIFSVFFAVFAVLLETDVLIGVVTRSLRFRLFMCTWLFGALILCTAYKGDNISALIVPQQRAEIYRDFDQLRDFTLFSESFRGMGNEPMGSWLGYEYTRYFSAKYDPLYLEAYSHGNMTNNTDKLDKVLLALYKNIITLNTTKSTVDIVEKYTKKCFKSAFVSQTGKINRLLGKLNEKQKQSMYYRGKQVVFNFPNSWEFAKAGGAKYFVGRMNVLLRSGIYEFWNRILSQGRFEKGVQNSDADRGAPISLESNIKTIFEIYISLCGLVLGEFFVEMFWKRGVNLLIT